MPSQPKPGYVPLHVAGPATLTDIVITALRLYLTQQGVLGA
jgi:hypothetical protein